MQWQRAVCLCSGGRLPETEGPDWHCTTCDRPMKLPSCLRHEESSGCRLWSTTIDRKHFPINGQFVDPVFLFFNTATNRHIRSWLSCTLSLCCLVWFYLKRRKEGSTCVDSPPEAAQVSRQYPRHSSLPCRLLPRYHQGLRTIASQSTAVPFR